jgi:hypothetical protein
MNFLSSHNNATGGAKEGGLSGMSMGHKKQCRSFTFFLLKIPAPQA